jgi:pimeloyl-ACP methyl ester carboxylesterase
MNPHLLGVRRVLQHARIHATQFALRHLLKPFAWAHEPLEHRMEELRVPLTFIYGENDWMDPAAAHRVTARLTQARSNRMNGSSGTDSCGPKGSQTGSSVANGAGPDESHVGSNDASGAGPNDLQVLLMEGAGHFPFLEQPLRFNAYVLETLQHCLDVRVGAQHDEVQYHGAVVDESNEGVLTPHNPMCP